MSDWRDLPAGPELDSYIAEALGLSVCRDEACTDPDCGTALYLRGGRYEYGVDGLAWSTEIKAAWALLAHIYNPVLERSGGMWRVRYRTTMWSKATPDAPLAICRAFLAMAEAFEIAKERARRDPAGGAT